MLYVNSAIQLLSLSRNFVEVDYFGEMLAQNNSLIQLDMAYNNYTMESIESLIKGLLDNKSLKKLRLSGMSIGQIHIHQFCEMLLKNSTLQEIEWDFLLNKEDFELITKLQESLMVNTTIINLNSNKFIVSM